MFGTESLLKGQAVYTQKGNRKITVKINLPLMSAMCKQNLREHNW